MTFRSCFLSGFIEFRSAAAEKKSKKWKFNDWQTGDRRRTILDHNSAFESSAKKDDNGWYECSIALTCTIIRLYERTVALSLYLTASTRHCGHPRSPTRLCWYHVPFVRRVFNQYTWTVSSRFCNFHLSKDTTHVLSVTIFLFARKYGKIQTELSSKLLATLMRNIFFRNARQVHHFITCQKLIISRFAL